MGHEAWASGCAARGNKKCRRKATSAFSAFLFALHSHVKVKRRKDREDKPVVCKSRERGAVEEFQEPENGNVGDDERCDEADGEHAEIGEGKRIPGFQQIIRHRQKHQRHGHDEGKIRGRFAGDAEEKGARDRAAATRKSGPEREALEKTDLERFARGNFIHIRHDEFPFHLFGDNHENAAGDEPDDDRQRSEKIIFNEPVAEEPHEAGREHRDRDIERRRAPIGKPIFPRQHRDKFIFIHDDDGKNRAELYKNIEDIRERPFKSEHMPDDYHMSRGGNRQIFRESFHNADDNGTKIFVHILSFFMK